MIAKKEEENGLKFYIISRSFDFAGLIVRAVMWVAIFYLGYLSIKELSGKVTDAKLSLSYFVSSDNDYGLPWVFSALLLVWALAERRLRHRKTEYFHSYIKKLELRLDPNRSSSELTSKGETNPEDKL